MDLIILIGIPASGKTTYAQSVLGDTHLRISYDVLRTRHRERTLFECALSTGTKVVVDNTNVTRTERARYVSSAKAAGYAVTGLYFPTALQEAQERNARRPPTQRVPFAGVGDKIKRLELPSRDEGFDELHVVRMTPTGFDVEGWVDGIG